MPRVPGALRLPTFLASAMAISLLLPVAACEESCDVIDGLYEPFSVAYPSPGTFDAWLASHPGYFTEKRLACLTESAQRFNKMYLDLADNCDDTHTQGSDFWVACMADADEVAGYPRDALFAIRAAASGVTPFSQSSFVSDYMSYTSAKRYEIFVLPFSDATIVSIYQKTMTCEKCTKPWWKFF